MILPLLALLQLGAADSMPRVTLEEALRRATRLDPTYVSALGRVDETEWGRRAARVAFVVPAITASVDMIRYSTQFFNIGTGLSQSKAVNGTLSAQYSLFDAVKFTDLARTRAEMESAVAGEIKARFGSALLTEADYYTVLRDQELARVGAERVRRAGEQLEVARARVVSGAAVQSDSLQLLLEFTRAQVDQLRLDAGLRVARAQLGRRIGEAGPADAAPLDSLPAPPLPMTLPDAITAALSQGPDWLIARANERSTAATLRARRGQYLPSVTIFAAHTRYDDHFFPTARGVSSLDFNVTLPIWNNGRREIALTQARVDHDVARAIRDDLQRAAQRDVTEAYEIYSTARATEVLSGTERAVAEENYRVQDARYRAGATTILDLLDAQFDLTQAEADAVQARYATRLALAGLEAILGRRLFPAT